MLFRIDHETHLAYSEPVTETVMELRMAPLSGDDQTVIGGRLRTAPSAAVASYRDGFGNNVDLLTILPAQKQIVLRASCCVRTHRRLGAPRLATPWPRCDAYPLAALPFLAPSPLVGRSPEVEALAAPLADRGATVADVVAGALEATRSRLTYKKKMTEARTPVTEALALGCGVCQDFSHLLIGLCRSLGLPARYVSGYVHQPGEIETHAWCQVWAGDGWVDVDPTYGTIVADDHIVTAVGRDYGDVPPNRGVWKGIGSESMTVTVKVEAVERVPPDWAETAPLAWRGATPPAPRPLSAAAVRHSVRLLHRHQSEQQQQAGPSSDLRGVDRITEARRGW